MTDVYAKHGIPMPPNPEEDKIVEEAESENVMAEPNTDWVKREQEERDRQLRLECLRLVKDAHMSSRIREAEKLFRYIKDGPDANVGLYSYHCGTCYWNWTAGERERGEQALAEHFRTDHPEVYKTMYGYDANRD